jgi:hypothetical protein
VSNAFGAAGVASRLPPSVVLPADLGTANASAYPHGIPSGGVVDITLIVNAVGYALTNCPAP